jgi:hypothetical protein
MRISVFMDLVKEAARSLMSTALSKEASVVLQFARSRILLGRGLVLPPQDGDDAGRRRH